MLGFHLMFRLADGRVLAPSARARRLLARVVLALGEAAGLVAFRAPDTHLHVVTLCDRERAGRFARSLAGALRKRLALPGPFGRTHVVPLADQRHLDNAVDYVLRNQERHGAAADLTHDASSLPDLLGLRTTAGWLVPRVREALPRLRRGRLLELLGAGDLDEAWSDDLAVEAAEAAGALPRIADRTPEALRVRASVARQWVGRRGALATALGVHRARVACLGELPVEPALDAAIRRQIGLRAALSVANGAAVTTL